jgi:hypothetical protein
VGDGGAVGALDWGGVTAAAAVDGGQEGRQRSGGGVSSGNGKYGGKEVRQCINKITGWLWSAC